MSRHAHLTPSCVAVFLVWCELGEVILRIPYVFHLQTKCGIKLVNVYVCASCNAGA